MGNYTIQKHEMGEKTAYELGSVCPVVHSDILPVKLHTNFD
jgi:hypothetical protein